MNSLALPVILVLALLPQPLAADPPALDPLRPGRFVVSHPAVDPRAVAVEAGDRLVASALAGHVLRAPEGAPPAALVGKALEPLEAGQVLLHVLVTLRGGRGQR
jgi:hypothetical protein